MSEYQRYEFMTSDRPLTRAQLNEVEALSSHIEASATHAIVEYNWGDFKHNPIAVLREFFDGFLYWANWGSPRLAFRFPHGVLPDDLMEGYDLEDFVEFTPHQDYDILDINFGEMEGPPEWVDYELGSLLPIRDELMEGDLRALYITWLASRQELGSDDEEEEYDIIIPPVPPAFGDLTAAQQALAELLQVPDVLLMAAARHSNPTRPSAHDDFAAWIELMPQERRNDYLLRLAHNEGGLSRLLIKELRELGRGTTQAAPVEGERVTYATLLAESKEIHAILERERRERERLERERRLQTVRDHKHDYWRQVDKAVARKSSSGYDEAVHLLVDLRDAADHFNQSEEFQALFNSWIRPFMNRPALLRRLHENQFTLP